MTPLGTVTVTVPGGTFTEECTWFPMTIAVSRTARTVEWRVDVTAKRGSSTATAFQSDFGSGTFKNTIIICASEGEGMVIASVKVAMWRTSNPARVQQRTSQVRFTVSRATTSTTIDAITADDTATSVSGTVLDASGRSRATRGGDLTIAVQEPGGQWTQAATGRVGAGGRYAVTLDRVLAPGTVVRASFAGTALGNPSVSAAIAVRRGA